MWYSIIQYVEAKYGISLKHFFHLISPIFGKKHEKFSLLAQLFKHFFIKIQPNMSEQKKKQQRICCEVNKNINPANYFLY